MRGVRLLSLRSYLWRNIQQDGGVIGSRYARAYSSELNESDKHGPNDVKERIEELERTSLNLYPRFEQSLRSKAISFPEFRHLHADLVNGETRAGNTITLSGRVKSCRVAGSGLVFFNISHDGHQVQGLVNLKRMAESVTPDQFRQFYQVLRRGDNFSITGHPHRTPRGELSIQATEIPILLSPCLHRLPKGLSNKEARRQNRHVDLIVNDQEVKTIKARSRIIQRLRSFLLRQNFLEVETPILASVAGGAMARPFTTSATEFPERDLSLRIAPELWLKRLVLGGLDRVFEIGPAFRNEGIDATHNPEYTTCEFYSSYANLEDLKVMTTALFGELVRDLKQEIPEASGLLGIDFDIPFNSISFIPALEQAIGRSLPNLSAQDAEASLLQIFSGMGLKVPTSPNVPRLLDALSYEYIETKIKAPTFITHHPSCLSPLSKSFIDPASNQEVSARAELFANGRELVNMYEEENSPFEQRRKFMQQAKFKGPENESDIDESYLEALEWGLPPTGGWGCGIDRLVMLFTGAPRIEDVRTFGNLRHVVALGRKA